MLADLCSQTLRFPIGWLVSSLLLWVSVLSLSIGFGNDNADSSHCSFQPVVPALFPLLAEGCLIYIDIPFHLKSMVV